MTESQKYMILLNPLTVHQDLKHTVQYHMPISQKFQQFWLN